MKPVIREYGRLTILHDADVLADFPPEYLDTEYWKAADSFEGEAEQGKGSTAFVRYDGQAWAMRHYYRGGAVARILRNAYLWLGLRRTRPWREWHLLADLFQQGLPVPEPIAASVMRHRFVYTACLVMRRIENAGTWCDYMREGDLTPSDWQALGRLIRRFHDHDVFHHDLNVYNILRQPDGGLYLIDFDKARKRSGTFWKRQNLARLHRSITKTESQGLALHFGEHCWSQLLQGYMLGG